MRKTVQINKSIGDKLKAISDKRKLAGELNNKQVEIVSDLINKLYIKEFKND